MSAEEEARAEPVVEREVQAEEAHEAAARSHTVTVVYNGALPVFVEGAGAFEPGEQRDVPDTVAEELLTNQEFRLVP